MKVLGIHVEGERGFHVGRGCRVKKEGFAMDLGFHDDMGGFHVEEERGFHDDNGGVHVEGARS